jgi:hypothetical protein
METLSLKLVFLKKNRKKLTCFDHFSPVVLELIGKSRAVLPLMFLGHTFSS